jgi:hypothetical protein
MSGDSPPLVTAAAGRVGDDLTRAADLARALHGCRRLYFGMSVSYVNLPPDEWREQELRRPGFPEHDFKHRLTMVGLRAANRYDRIAHDVKTISGMPATSAGDFVAHHGEFFGPARSLIKEN